MKTSRIITIMLLSVALVLTAFSTAFAVSVQADGASGEPLSGLKNSILVDTKLKTSSYLDTVSSKGANVSYFATESSFTQIYGQTGSGISSGAITPVIPVDAISFGCIPESIIGTDDRVKVNNTTVYPYRTSTFLLIKFPNSPYSYLGSGHLISPDTVLTAGHCVYDQALGGWATVEVYPGYNGTTAPYGVAYSTEIYSVSGWINNRSPEHDIAAIKLDRPIGEQTGWLGLTDMTSGAITITGYPGEFQRQMYTMSGTIASVTTNNTFYTIDTTGGNSGSGVYNNNNQIVAVHAYGGATQNSGTRINSEKLSIVNTWIGNGRDNHLPRGAFESATNANSSIISSWRIIGASNKVRVTGWAIDDDIPSASIGIHVLGDCESLGG